MIKYNEFLLEKLGIPEPVVQLRDYIIKKFGDMKAENTVYYISSKDLPYPFNKLKYLELRIGEKGFDKNDASIGKSYYFIRKKDRKFVGIIVIRKERIIQNVVMHELLHLYQDCLKNKENNLTTRYKEYNRIANEFSKKENDEEVKDFLDIIKDYLYYSTPEEMDARISEIYHDMMNIKDLNKKKFLKFLENHDSYVEYKDMYNHSVEWMNYIVNHEKYSITEKKLKKIFPEYSENIKSFLIRLGKDTEQKSQKFLRRAHKLYYFKPEDDYIKYPKIFK